MPFLICPYAKVAMITKYPKQTIWKLQEAFTTANDELLEGLHSTPTKVLVEDHDFPEESAMELSEAMECRPEVCGKAKHCGGCYE